MLLGVEMPSAGEDLAVLSLCNHSIVGAGTYGQWGALLAGGQVIYPTGYGLRVTHRPGGSRDTFIYGIGVLYSTV